MVKEIQQLELQIETMRQSNTWRIATLLHWVRRFLVREHTSLASTATKDVHSSTVLQEAETFVLRLSRFIESATRIAYFAENTHSSTFRYRAENMAEVLNNRDDAADLQTSAACFFSSDFQHAQSIADNANLLVISRARYEPELAALVALFKAQGKPVLYDIDDLVFDVRDVDLIIASQGQDATDEVLNYWFGVVGRLSRALLLCDGAITTNAFLAAKLQAFLQKPVHVIPNFINHAQWQVTAPLYQSKLANGFAASDRIRLGYFSGSASHNRDLGMLASALEQLMLADDRVDLVLVGHIDLEAALGPRFAALLQSQMPNRIVVHGFTDYLHLQSLIAGVDYNLVPLHMNDFTDCKSELKYFDAAAVGTVTIASPSYAYAAAIKHGLNGYLAGEGDWLAVLTEAIDMRQRYAAVAQNAYADVQQRYVWWQQRDTVLHALGLD
jgi:glycosyltransferase involved in cell wall biosynthesis